MIYKFSGCDGLTSIKVESGNTIYDSRDNCNAIIETSNNNLVAGCKNTIIPNSVITIDEYAFYDCIGLKSVDIPNSVTSIGDFAFYYCSSLTSINIPNSVTSIGSSAFYYCSSLTSINIPNSVTSIDREVFIGCSSLTSVNIGNSVTSIGDRAFLSCGSLTSVTIPNSVTEIGELAFQGCSGLISVKIPDSVTVIGNNAFSWCSSLTSINIPNSVTSIDRWVFMGCSGLTSITIPNSVTEIGIMAFYGCSSLQSVTCLIENPFEIDNSVFEYSISDTTTLYVPKGTMQLYQNTSGWNEFPNIAEISGGDTPGAEKCATPTISFSNGELKIECETPDVQFFGKASHSEQQISSSKLTLDIEIVITVYATKEGYEDSEPATLTLKPFDAGTPASMADITRMIEKYLQK